MGKYGGDRTSECQVIALKRTATIINKVRVVRCGEMLGKCYEAEASLYKVDKASSR